MSSTLSVEQHEMYAVASITYIFVVIAVALRFWTRRLLKTQIWLDDWLVAAALLFATGYLIKLLVWFHQGFGESFEDLTEHSKVIFFKHYYADEILYFAIIGLVKFSILTFYWRIFKSTSHIPCSVLAAITACWVITGLLMVIFQCSPVSGFWDQQISAKCSITDHNIFWAQSAPNILTDVALLFLPVPYVWRLQRTTSQKIALAVTFLLGGIVTVISIIRLLLTVTSDNWPSHADRDQEYNPVPMAIWLVTEFNMAIVSACLPSLRPILSLIIYGDPKPAVRYSLGKTLARPWIQGQQHQTLQVPLEESPRASSSRLRFSPLSDEAYGFVDIEQLSAIAVVGNFRLNGDEDVERGFQGAVDVRRDLDVELGQKK
ncbi:hypothetical protein BDR22DRAFT_889848 [Usnea florida]